MSDTAEGFFENLRKMHAEAEASDDLTYRYEVIDVLLRYAQSDDAKVRLAALKLIDVHTRWLLERSRAVLSLLDFNWSMEIRHYPGGPHTRYIDVASVRNTMLTSEPYAAVLYAASGFDTWQPTVVA